MSHISRPPDDRLTTIFSSLPADSTHFSLEFFPPKTSAGFANLQSRLSRMSTALRPLFITVTWGAGGSTATKSLELAEICQRQLDIPTVLHLTCTNSTQKVVDEALETCKSVGIRNILALRGDPPRDEYKDENHDTTRQDITDYGETFVWAIDLVRYIRQTHGDYFCIGVAGYPEGHADESHPETGKQSVDHDLPYLAAKVRAGADFIMTQLTYDIHALQRYESKLDAFVDKDNTKDIFATIPVIPGLMPIQSYKVINRVTKLSHAKFPDHFWNRIEAVRNDDEEVKKVGVEILAELVRDIRALAGQKHARVLHFYTLNLEKSVAFLLERCGLISPASVWERHAEADAKADTTVSGDGRHQVSTTSQGMASSSSNPHPQNQVIVDGALGGGVNIISTNTDERNATLNPREADAGGSPKAAAEANRSQKLAITEGQGALGREATWDDFPNGRWGPSHSPAFGEIDGYGPSLKVGPITARKLWGHPKQREDVTDIFRRHVLGELHAVPWSDEVDGDGTSGSASALRAETDVIRPELQRLIETKGYWTLASQPAVDGVRSDDPVFGWGPRAEGFVFQKAFVEFFCPRDEWPSLKRKLQSATMLEYSWLKTDAHGQFESSDQHDGDHLANGPTSKRTPGTSGINAVTWGVFKAKEIVTPTIIEAESFRAWGEEAYSIWGEWRRCFPRGCEEEQCLERIRQDVVLVNVVAQNYVGGHEGAGRGLWDFLLDDAAVESVKMNGH